jgi:hypothetical protein
LASTSKAAAESQLELKISGKTSIERSRASWVRNENYWRQNEHETEENEKPSLRARAESTKIFNLGKTSGRPVRSSPWCKNNSLEQQEVNLHSGEDPVRKSIPDNEAWER